MEENGGKWGKLGGNGEIAGVARGMWVVEGCGGMRNMGHKWEKVGEKWDEMLMFYSPISPLIWRSKTFPSAPFIQISAPHPPDGKLGILATHRHSPPRRLVRILEPKAPPPANARQAAGIPA